MVDFEAIWSEVLQLGSETEVTSDQIGRGHLHHRGDDAGVTARELGTRGELLDRCQRWIPHHPEAFVMADGHLHRTTCPEVADLGVFSELVGVHKDPWALIDRAMAVWEGFLRCLSLSSRPGGCRTDSPLRCLHVRFHRVVGARLDGAELCRWSPLAWSHTGREQGEAIE